MSEILVDNEIFTIVIESIGDATPASAILLAEGLGLPEQVVLHALYRTPSVLVRHVDAANASKSVDLLSRIGLKAKIVPGNVVLPLDLETVDVGVYVPNASYLPNVVHQLAEFLGTSKPEAMQLLLNEPAVVLGGVSMSTADALASRLDAEVICSVPSLAKYSLTITTNEQLLIDQVASYLHYLEVPLEKNWDRYLRNLDYSTSQKIWGKFRATNALRLCNQDFEHFDLVLESVDISNPKYRDTMVELTGMPASIVDQVVSNLPILLEDSVRSSLVLERLGKYSEAGLFCKVSPNGYAAQKVTLTLVPDPVSIKKILKTIFPQLKVPAKIQIPWAIPIPMGNLYARFVQAQVEALGGETAREDWE